MKKLGFLLLLIPVLRAQTSPCDVNGDGVVNSLDVQAAINQALGLAACNADLDQNGRCDVVDVQRVIVAALGGACNAAGGVVTPPTNSPPPTSAGPNTLTVYEVDSISQNRVITFGRVFKQGEIAQCPQPVIGGAPVSGYQADVKNRWGDGSVKFAVVSFNRTLAAGGSTQVSFQNASSCNNSGYLTQTQMVNFNGGNWGADIEVTAGGVTRTADAKTMLQSLGFQDCQVTYWLQGPVVTQIVLQDCTSSSSYDFGWHWDGSSMSTPVTGNAATASLHPVFILSFYPATGTVKVDYILENMWSSRWQDQQYSFVLKSGSPLAAVYSRPAFTHIAGTRWRKTFWSGAAAGHIRIDHNFPYLISTMALPNYDQSVAVNPSGDYSRFAAGDKGDIAGYGLDTWQGGHSYSANNEGAPLQREDLEYLYNMGSCGTANSACAQAWYILTGERGNMDSTLAASVSGGAGMWNNQGNVPYHMRESRAGGSFYCPGYADKDATPTASCGAGVGNPVGRALSRHAHPGDQYQDAILPVAATGAFSFGGWSVSGCSHWLDYSYVPYILTGDYYYLDEEYLGASYCVNSVNSGAASGSGNGFYGYIAPVQGGARGWAWGMQVLGRAAFLAPDGSAESQYYKGMVSSNAEVEEGAMGILGTGLTPSHTNAACNSYNFTAANRWDWGRCTVISQCTTGVCSPIPVNQHSPIAGECYSVVTTHQGSVTAAVNSNPALLTSSAPHGLTRGYPVSFWGATGGWVALNNAFDVSNVVDATHFNIPLNSTSFGPLSGALSFSDGQLDKTKVTDFVADWMNWQVIAALGHLQEIGLAQLSPVATQISQRLIEEVLDPGFNPYLVAQYVTPAKNGGSATCVGLTTLNPFYATWSGVKGGFVPYLAGTNTFNFIPDGGLTGNYPCADHGYSLLARAAGTYITHTTSGSLNGSDAWTWLQAEVPYFNNSPLHSNGCGANNDTQIKYALAPR